VVTYICYNLYVRLPKCFFITYHNFNLMVHMPKEEMKILEEQIKKKLDEKTKKQSELLPIFEFKKEGDTIIGKVLNIRTVFTRIGQRKLLEIRTSDGDYAIWLSRKVLEEELTRQDVKPGDYIGIRFLGRQPGKRYYNYAVVKL